MPQMAPMNWLVLFSLFTTIFMMFNHINYFTYIKTTPIKNINKNLFKSLIWKW